MTFEPKTSFESVRRCTFAASRSFKNSKSKATGTTTEQVNLFTTVSSNFGEATTDGTDTKNEEPPLGD